MKRYCLGLDLKNDPALIDSYKHYHQKIWPEVRDHLRSTGIREMEIYLLHNRLYMIMEVDDSFSFAAKAAAEQSDPRVQEWEQLMAHFQQTLPNTPPGEKWLLMENVFRLSDQ